MTKTACTPAAPFLKVAAYAKMGPVRVIEETTHHHGRLTKPYIVSRTYEDQSETIRVTTLKTGGCLVKMALLSRDYCTPGHDLIRTWEKGGKYFHSVKAAIAWMTR